MTIHFISDVHQDSVQTSSHFPQGRFRPTNGHPAQVHVPRTNLSQERGKNAF
jgi:hypothetical protein